MTSVELPDFVVKSKGHFVFAMLSIPVSADLKSAHSGELSIVSELLKIQVSLSYHPVIP